MKLCWSDWYRHILRTYVPLVYSHGPKSLLCFCFLFFFRLNTFVIASYIWYKYSYIFFSFLLHSLIYILGLLLSVSENIIKNDNSFFVFHSENPIDYILLTLKPSGGGGGSFSACVKILWETFHYTYVH